MKPSQKQIDFATEIAETCGDDLPGEISSSAYSEFIASHMKEFKKIKAATRYSDGRTFALGHSYGLDEGYNGDGRLAFNPYTRGGKEDG